MHEGVVDVPDVELDELLPMLEEGARNARGGSQAGHRDGGGGSWCVIFRSLVASVTFLLETCKPQVGDPYDLESLPDYGGLPVTVIV